MPFAQTYIIYALRLSNKDIEKLDYCVKETGKSKDEIAKKKEKWLRQHLDLPNGIPIDDTYRIVIGNIDTGHFFQMAVQLLIDTVNRIPDISGMNRSIYEKSVLSLDGKISCGSARKETADGNVKALQTLNVYSGD